MTSEPASPPSGPPSAGPPPGTPPCGALAQIAASGLLSAAAVAVVGGVLSYALWDVLAIPGKLLKDAIPRGDCTTEQPGSNGMYVCSVRAGLLTALGPLIALVVAVLFRRPLMAQAQRLTAKLPDAAPFVAPLMSTAMFTLVHAALHEDTDGQTGLVPQRFFPALVGLFAFGAGRLGPVVGRRFGETIARRDVVPTPVRALLALAVPLAVSYVLTDQQRVSDTAQKEQLVVLLTMCTSYAAFVPRDGDFVGAGQRFLAARLARRAAP